jgi:hypothetical protein
MAVNNKQQEKGVENFDDGLTRVAPKGKFKAQEKPKVIILDDNELSIAEYAKEFPENFKKITEGKQQEKQIKEALGLNGQQQWNYLWKVIQDSKKEGFTAGEKKAKKFEREHLIFLKQFINSKGKRYMINLIDELEQEISEEKQ